MAKKEKAAPAAEGRLRLADHPRAQRQIRQAKGWGGLLGFVLVVLLSLRAGVPVADGLGRALVGGVVGMVAGRLAAVVCWQHLARAEIEAFRLALVAQLESRGD